MKLLVALTAELGLLIAAWAYLGEIVRGSDASTVTLYVNGYIAAFLTVTEMLVAIAFSMIAVYWIPVLIGEIVDVRARSGNVKKSATFPISPFTVGIYIFILCCKVRPFEPGCRRAPRGPVLDVCARVDCAPAPRRPRLCSPACPPS